MIKIRTTHLEAAYHQVNSEEGRYDARCGWNIIATDTEGNHWLFAGKKEDPEAHYHPPVCFPRQKVAQTYANRIQAQGINEKYWWHFESPTNDLPDYVINPWRPEYN